jgi:hypothetical protein
MKISTFAFTIGTYRSVSDGSEFKVEAEKGNPLMVKIRYLKSATNKQPIVTTAAHINSLLGYKLIERIEN